MDKTLRVLGYARVSTNKQEDEGLSLPVQVKRLKSYPDLYPHIDLVEVVQETGSAKTLDRRPKLAKVLERLNARDVDGLLIVKLDRLTRNIGDLHRMLTTTFRDGTATLIAVQEYIDTSTANGRMMLNVMTTMSQWEREAISERTRAVIDDKKTRNEKVGSVPLGYRAEVNAQGVKVLVRDAGEQMAIAEAGALHNVGATLREIAEKLDVDFNLRSRTGKRYLPEQVRRLIAAYPPA